MSVPSMEELARVFEVAHRNACGFGAQPEGVFPGLLAVLDRLKPVVAHAHFDGQAHADFNGAVRSEPSDDYATRIIDQIKGA